MELERLDQLHEETAAAFRHEKRVFERIEQVGKWTTLTLLLLAVGSVVWTWTQGGLPALQALFTGK